MNAASSGNPVGSAAESPLLGVVPALRPVRFGRPLLLGVFYAVALFPMTLLPKVSDNVLSRYMAIEAVVDHGTLSVDRTRLIRLAHPVDLVRFGTHYYSDKPPVLIVLASPIYAVLERMGLRFNASLADIQKINLALTWTVSGLASSLTLYGLRRMFQALAFRPGFSDLLTLAFGFGSQLLTYAVTFNNHSVAASCLVGALVLTMFEPLGGRAKYARFGVGMLSGLAATIDLPAGGLFLFGLGVLHLARARSIPRAFLAGSAGPLILHAGLQSMVTGSPLPVEMYPQAFIYPGSFWLTDTAKFEEYGPRYAFAAEMLLGPAGWLTLTPSLAFGLVGLALVLFAGRRDPLWPIAAVVAGSAIVLVSYYTWGVRRTDFAGQSFGVRHLLAITPPVYFFAAVALDRLRGRLASSLFALLTIVGVFYAAVGMQRPWARVEELERDNRALREAQKFVIYPYSRTRAKFASERAAKEAPSPRPPKARP